MASFLRRPSNNANPKRDIVRFGKQEPPQPLKQKKGSFVSLLTGGSNQNNNYYYDNGLDPLGRLSTDSAPPPPPSPSASAATSAPIRKADAHLHWTEELFALRLPESSSAPSPELVARIKYFLSQKDPSAQDRALHLARYAQQEGEPALNAKLFVRFGDGLPLRLPGQRTKQHDGPVPKTLRELLRAFLLEHDPGYLAIEGENVLDDMLAQAAEYGIDSLESELTRKYGCGINGKKGSSRTMINPSYMPPQGSVRDRENSSFDQMARAAAPIESSSPGPLSPVINAPKVVFEQPPKIASPTMMNRAKSEKPQTFVELGLDDDDEARGSVVRPVVSPVSTSAATKKHNFFDEKSLRADLKMFYQKHDPKKLDGQKFEPIVQWAYKIGPGELNRRFEEKYGESLNTFIENVQNGRPGVAPGVKAATKAPDGASQMREVAAACKTYKEANPGKGFGVCSCGFSRVDHKMIKSLLTPGADEPHFNRAKPKIVISKHPAPSSVPAKQIGGAPAAPQVSNGKPAGSKPMVSKPVVAPAPKYEVKAAGRDGPCAEYRLDLEGRSFGVCKCGWSRPEHNKAKQQVAWAVADSD